MTLPSDARDRLRAIGAFRRELETPGFEPGRWHHGERDGGVLQMPWYELSERGRSFVSALGGLLLDGFDWPAWARTPTAQALHDDRSRLARATADELARLVTALVRQDRFNEGSLGGDFETGLLLAVARRAEALATEPVSG